MADLALKIVLTPVLIGAASLAGRRWGEAVGGWLVGLPLTSGPVAFFLALDYGPQFAGDAALGSLAGVVAQAAFAVAYAWAAGWLRWPAALAIGAIGFALSGALLQWTAPSPLLLLVLAAVALALALGLMPAARLAAAAAVAPRWDIPARMAVATALVVGLTAVAPIVGPRLSGLLATFPVFAAVLTVFAHRTPGPAAARQVLWGLLLGLFAFAGFFAVINLAIERAGIATSFAAAILCAGVIQGVTLRAMRGARSS
jgi:hypothetical protein